MKALRLRQIRHCVKYLGYALLATVGGSVIGVLVGEKILPFIIIYAYEIMYHHIPKILVPYNWQYAAIASFAAIICTMAATFLACYRRELDAASGIDASRHRRNGKEGISGADKDNMEASELYMEVYRKESDAI